MNHKIMWKKLKAEAGVRLLSKMDKIENAEFDKRIANVCGNCRYWRTCRSTEGWRINSPCTGFDGVKFKKKRKKDK